MNADRLLAHFDRLADAPDAVPRLRRLILDLAVRGKLVPQDPNDEPASSIVKRIILQKQRSAYKENPSSDATTSDVSNIEAPFSIPFAWQWSPLCNLLIKLTDGTHHSPPSYEKGDYKYITAKNIKPEGVILDDITYVDAAIHNEIYKRCDPKKGDLLYIKDGATTGIVAINDLDEPFSMLSSVAMLRPALGVYNKLLVYFLRSPFVYERMRGSMKGAAITRLTLKRMAPALIPLPPLAEQHRIVAKVDELMALCDRLEAAQAEREGRRDGLVRASLARLTQPDDAAAAFRDHARFALDNLPRLATRPEHVAQLRRTILDLAVRGKLVPQDQKDEPATILLDRIHWQRENLIAQGTVKRFLPTYTPATHDGLLTRTPEGWRWVRLSSLLLCDSQNGYSRKPDEATDGIPILRISAGTLRQDGVVAEEEHKRIGNITADQREQFSLNLGDLLACRFNGNRSSVGRLALFRDYLQINPIYPDKLIRLRLVSQYVLPRLIQYFGESDIVRRDIEQYCATTVGNWGISASNLKEVIFPLPPLAEQHRIVAKVDELIALCDQLEAQLTAAQDCRTRLLEAVLHEALQGAPLSDLTNCG